MADEVFGLGAADVPRLKRLLDAFESGELHEGFLSRRSRLGDIPTVYLGWTDTAISAASGSTFGATPGTGTVSIVKIGSTGTLDDAGFNETVYNMATSAVSTGKWVMMKRDAFSGKLVVDFEDCST